MIATPYHPISAPLISQVVAYERLKTKENFKLLVLSKSDGGRLREVQSMGDFT